MSKYLYSDFPFINTHRLQLRKQIRNLLSFSKSEANGVIILIPLIIFFVFSPYLYKQFFGVNYSTVEEDKRLLDSLVAYLEYESVEEPIAIISIEYHPFDPNSATVEELVGLGVPKFLSHRIDNYRSKGGGFRVKKDLKKIFDFPDSLYQKLHPFILLPETIIEPANNRVKNSKNKQIVLNKPLVPSFNKDSSVEEPIEEKNVLLNLNAADTTALKSIRGIGSSYSKRIVAYRKLLGGYHDVVQLKEVYGMTDTLYQAIKQYLIISDTATISKVNINIATFKQLLAHPYINYEQTKEILNTKSKHGKFMKPEDLFRLKLMDSLEVEKLLPYLSFK